ncbi:MAG: 1,4-dihydroxy-2-naphthoate octaprenyltransferase [Crocinitomicaceae bacterium]|jgi:1,4-dihydroxy-2-naphthoate octaprenyltransferase|tara:strand:+ start:24474 stop:25388 length:915 start_codon:yes stop_codon:yes gene_type:complete
MTKIKVWIGAMRLRTLPLSLSGIIIGSGLAGWLDCWDSTIFMSALLTTVLFQVLSNLANDLGDSQKGTDNENRIGPMRAVQSGVISIKEMKIGVLITSLLAIMSAVLLIYFSLPNLSNRLIVFYGFLAIACILAAILYTVGKSAYGYAGLGDIMVFVFFGFVSVLGVFSLYGLDFEWLTLLPALSMGSWSAAVLNLNNMRDVENDKASGKNTIAVKLGAKRATYYHASLVLLGMFSWSILIGTFFYLTMNPFIYIALIPSFLFFPHLRTVFSSGNPKSLDPELKKVALIAFSSAILLVLSLLIL